MASVKDFEELAIFQKARELSQKIYPVTNKDVSSQIFASYNRYEQQLVPSWTISLKDLSEMEIGNL